MLFQWNGSQGGQSLNISAPRELRNVRPPVGPQPITSWATQLAAFQALCSANLFQQAIEYLCTEHVFALTSDVPGGSLAGFQTYVQNSVRTLPPNLAGATTGWTSDGSTRDRSPI